MLAAFGMQGCSSSLVVGIVVLAVWLTRSWEGEYVILVTHVLRYAIRPMYGSPALLSMPLTVCTAHSLDPLDWVYVGLEVVTLDAQVLGNSQLLYSMMSDTRSSGIPFLINVTLHGISGVKVNARARVP